jgi:hypothetical protein
LSKAPKVLPREDVVARYGFRAFFRKRLEYVVSSIMVLQVTSETLAKLGK